MKNTVSPGKSVRLVIRDKNSARGKYLQYSVNTYWHACHGDKSNRMEFRFVNTRAGNLGLDYFLIK